MGDPVSSHPLQSVVDAMHQSAAKLSESKEFIAGVAVELIEHWAANIQVEIDASNLRGFAAHQGAE